MSRKHGKRSGSVKCARESGCGGNIIGFGATLHDADTGMYVTGASAIVTVVGSEPRRMLRRYVRDNPGIVARGIGEPIAVGRNGDVWDEWRLIASGPGAVYAVARLLAAETRPDWVSAAHFDCPIRVGQLAVGSGPDKIRASGKPARPSKRKQPESSLCPLPREHETPRTDNIALTVRERHSFRHADRNRPVARIEPAPAPIMSSDALDRAFIRQALSTTVD